MELRSFLIEVRKTECESDAAMNHKQQDVNLRAYSKSSSFSPDLAFGLDLDCGHPFQDQSL